MAKLLFLALCIYCVLLLFRGEKVSLFSQIALCHKSFFVRILLSRVPKIGSVTGNHESFLNKRKDVRPGNFFTTKQKQYTVHTHTRIRIHRIGIAALWKAIRN